MTFKHLLPALLFASLAGIARAEDVWIIRPAVLRSDSIAAGDEIAKVVKGDKGIILERSGAWIKVNLNGNVGWVAATSTSARPVKADTALLGGNSSVQSSSGAAGKGLQPKAEQYALDKHYTKASVDEMIAFRKTITSKMLKDFVVEGNIQP